MKKNILITILILLMLILITGVYAVPSWNSNQTNIVADYSVITESYFNITWQTADNISVVWFESNYSGSSQNYSMNLISGTLADGIYNYSSIFPAGNFYWKSYANDSLNNWTSSDTWQFSINKLTSNCSLIFNPASPQNFQTAINASCSCTNLESSAKLYRNGTDVTVAENNQFTNLSAGVYSYVCNTSSSENYTAANSTADYTITKITTTLTLNADDWSVDEGTDTTVNCTADNDDVNITLYLDGIEVTNPHTDTLDPGTYTYTCNATATENYTGATTQHDLTVNEDSGSSGGSGGGGAIIKNKGELTKQGFTFEMKSGRIFKFEGNGETHTIKNKKIGISSATIIISSDPIEVSLNVNESEEIDLDGNGYNDAEITLTEVIAGTSSSWEIVSIDETEDEIVVIDISEENETIEDDIVIEEEDDTPPPAEVDIKTKEEQEEIKQKNNVWMWIIIIVLILIAVFLVFKIFEKRKK